MRYWIDSADRLARVDDAWRAFAVMNGAPELASESILNRHLFSFCSDLTTQQVWASFLTRVRGGASIKVQIRCDAPGWRRLFDVHLSSEGGMVAVVAEPVWEEGRPRVELLEVNRLSTDALLVCCSWCKKWRTSAGLWVEVEELVSELDLMQHAQLPRVSHGICEECRRKFWGGRRRLTSA